MAAKTKPEVDCDLMLDSEIDKLLEEKAAKTNLTVFNVKSIINRIIKDETVQKIIKFQTRRREREDGNKDEKEGTSGTNSDSELEDLLNFEPKLTRAKTKELIQNSDKSQIPLWPISPSKFLQVNTHTQQSETQILITSEEFPEESEAEDDEYIPKNDELQAISDDESNTSMSDIGSPATPGIPKRMENSTLSKPLRKRTLLFGPGSPSKSPSKMTSNDEAIFKTPPQKKLKMVHDTAIGLRTRSKLPLNDTPMEDLEKQLIPPDITPDMYEWNESDNEDYLQFLKGFTVSSLPEGNDDEEADPEYNVMEDEDDEQDKEEHRVDRAVKVSKKELNDLITELLNSYEVEVPSGDEFEDLSSSVSQNTLKGNELKVLKSPSKIEKPSATITSNQKSSLLNKSPSSELLSTNTTIDAIPTTSIGDCNMPNNKSDADPIQVFGLKLIPPQNQQILIAPQIVFVSPPPPPPLFTPEMFQSLRDQMQKHIQLLATTYVISSNVDNPPAAKVANSAKSMLLEIASSAKKYGSYSAYDGKNLSPAVGILRSWPSRVHANSPIKKKILEEHGYKSFSQPQSDEERASERTINEYKMMKLIAESSAFMYPSLLPSCFIYSTHPVVAFTSGEDALVARGIEELKSEKLDAKQIANILGEFMLPPRSIIQIYNRIKNVKKSVTSFSSTTKWTTGTCLKDYFITNKLPPIENDIYIPNVALAPVSQPKEYLSPKWLLFIKRLADNEDSEKTPVIVKLQKKPPGRKEVAVKKHNATVKHIKQEQVIRAKPESSFGFEYKEFTITNDNGEPQFVYAVPVYALKEETNNENVTMQTITKEDEDKDITSKDSNELNTIIKCETNNENVTVKATTKEDEDKDITSKDSNEVNTIIKCETNNENDTSQNGIIEEEEDEEVTNDLSEAFILKLRGEVNEKLYLRFLNVVSECEEKKFKEEEICKKIQEVLTDFPHLVKEFVEIQSGISKF